MTTIVVNCRTDEYDVFIGRPSIYSNSYVIGRDGTREQVIEKFKASVRSKPELIARARRELKGKRLGCFCKPKACHGDIWVDIVEENI